MFSGQFYPYQPIQFMDGLLSPIIGMEAVVPFDASYITYAAQNPGSTTVVQSIDIGVADATRVTVIAFATTTNTTFSSATINGVSATILSSVGTNAGGGLIYAAVPTGSGVVNVQLTTGVTVSNIGFGSYRLVGTGLSATPSSTNNPAGGGGATRTATLTNTAGGVSIIEGRSNNTNTISNVDTMNVNNILPGSGDGYMKAGIDFPTTAGSLGYSITSSRQVVGAHWSAP